MKDSQIFASERNDEGRPFQISLTTSERNMERTKVRRSATWAAYGDALGWISELTDSKGLLRRTKGEPLSRPVAWRRKIGGWSGIDVTLPQGCYSDDSQLRLATGRAIGFKGFDVEAFSKVELPIWLSYALGGGRSTSAAARNLARRNVEWYANHFKGWANSGGNGAAMRIQPHVWSARNLRDATTFLNDVVLNAICTHSHPHGILGAVVHALALAHTMVNGRSPGPRDLIAALKRVSTHIEEFLHVSDVGQIWLASYGRETGPFRTHWELAIAECVSAIQSVNETRKDTGPKRYQAIIEILRLRDRDRMGSGMLTAVAAIGLTWCEADPERALKMAANTIGTDTDTIATMAGALLGLTVDDEPPVEVMDGDLIRSEADRMYGISQGMNSRSFPYPDLLHWVAPKTQADCLVISQSGEYHVRGLGFVKQVDPPIRARTPGFMWQWVKTGFGQTLLIKRRENLTEFRLPAERISETNRFGKENRSENRAKMEIPSTLDKGTLPRFEDLPFNDRNSAAIATSPVTRDEFDQMIGYLENRNFDDRSIGAALRSVVNRCTIYQTMEFLAIVTKRLSEADAKQPPYRR